MRELKLMIPGPVDCYEDVLAEMSSAVLPHYGKDWLEIYSETVALLKEVFRTQNDLYIMVAPGTPALEAAMASLVASDEGILVVANGFFSARLGVVARSYGIETHVLEFPLGKSADPQCIRDYLKANSGIEAVVVAHHETSTTVVNPVREIAAVAHEFDLPIIVDAISSLGGMPVPVDEWDLDVVVTVANKCLETPPGLAPLSVSERAWRVMDSKPKVNHGWYFDLRVWRDYAERWGAWHPYPTTLATNNIVALRASLRKIVAEGLEARFERYARAARVVRQGLLCMGFEMFVDEASASPLVTAAKPMPGCRVSDLQHYLKDVRGIMIAGGLDELAGKIFRVGHIGKAASREYIMDFLFSTEECLRRRGLAIPVGVSLQGLAEE